MPAANRMRVFRVPTRPTFSSAQAPYLSPPCYASRLYHSAVPPLPRGNSPLVSARSNGGFSAAKVGKTPFGLHRERFWLCQRARCLRRIFSLPSRRVRRRYSLCFSFAAAHLTARQSLLLAPIAPRALELLRSERLRVWRFSKTHGKRSLSPMREGIDSSASRRDGARRKGVRHLLHQRQWVRREPIQIGTRRCKKQKEK